MTVSKYPICTMFCSDLAVAAVTFHAGRISHWEEEEGHSGLMSCANIASSLRPSLSMISFGRGGGRGGGQKVPNGKFIFHPAESPGEKFKNYKFRMLSPADMILNGSWRNVKKMWSPNFILPLNLCIYYRNSSHIHICMKPHRV